MVVDLISKTYIGKLWIVFKFAKLRGRWIMIDNRISFQTNHQQSMFQIIEKYQTSEEVV